MALVMVFALAACKPRATTTAGQFGKAFSKADTLWACKVDGYPTPAAEQRKDLRYLHGYEVKEVHPLLATEIDAVKAALLDSLTFDMAAVKSCPMVAQYAVAVRKNGRSPVALVLSPSPCGKALLFDKQHAEKPVSMELRPGNKLEGILASIW